MQAWEEQSELKGVYGRGWAFPVEFAAHGVNEPAVSMVVDGEDIAQSLQILFSTQPCERIMRADYGCDLQAFMFGNVSETLLAQIRTCISEAVARHEQRVRIGSIEIEQDGQQPWHLRVQLAYRIQGTDELRHLNADLNLGEARRRFFR